MKEQDRKYADIVLSEFNSILIELEKEIMERIIAIPDIHSKQIFISTITMAAIEYNKGIEDILSLIHTYKIEDK